MIKSKSEKGITLTTLVVTIVVLLILAGVATSTGIEAIENTKFTKFKAELKIMQSHVNQWYEDCKPSVNAQNYGETFTTNIQNKLTVSGAISATSEEEGNSEKVQKAQDTLNKANVPSANYGNYYLLEENTKNSLGVEGVSQEVLVSVKDRKVVSYLGLKYKNKMYYTIDDQSGEGIGEVYNVEYDSSKSSGTATFDVSQEYIGNGKAKISISNIQFGGYNNKWQVKYKVGDGNWNTSNDLNFLVTDSGHYTVTLYNEGISGTNEIDVLTAPECWKATTASDPQWYSYGGAKVNSPKLVGKMAPIKYDGELTDSMNKTNLWANAETADQSMWVWIPRYAYKINYFTDNTYTTRSSTKTMYGTIDIAFLKNDTDEFWDSSNAEIAEITRYPTDEGAGTTKWLVHPAFTVQYNQDETKNYENGGWDTELTGIWVGKFEATGTYTDTNKELSVKHGTPVVTNMTINQQYKFAQTGTFKENLSSQNLGSHMAKNSEWGAIVYLAYSNYGTQGKDVSKQSNTTITGDSSIIKTIYNNNYLQSTTSNPYGIYGLRGGVYDRVASYVNYGNNSNYLSTYGGTNIGDLYGKTYDEQSTSTKYKTVYVSSGTNLRNSYDLLGNTSIKKGDAIWETSVNPDGFTSWNHMAGNTVSSLFPRTTGPFFNRSAETINVNTGMFFFSYYNGINRFME